MSNVDNEDDELPQLVFNDIEIDQPLYSVREVELILSKLKTNKCSGPDFINNCILSSCSNGLYLPFTTLFNLCQDKGVFPDLWKSANVIPLHKKDDPSSCQNYRPISLISSIGKIFEKLMHNHIYKFLVQNNILTKFQSGFIKNDSTVYQLIDIYDNVLKNLDQTKMIFFDISRAFDRIWLKALPTN